MGNVNVDLQTLQKIFTNINNANSSITQTKSKLTSRYQSMNGSWKDVKYYQLGLVVDECKEALTSLEQLLMDTKSKLLPIVKAIQDYESVSLNGASSTTSSSSSNTSDFNSSIRNLSSTRQTSENLFLNGRNVTVFDHPFDANDGRICNQGSAYPTGPQQTCGCCASATIVNKAGGSINEHDIVNYAYSNGYCDVEGRTTPNNWCAILNGLGVNSRISSGSSLENLATQVESGHGVIIGVDARAYAPDLYSGHGGHALVLESVIRDSNNGEIVEYVVSDSNGSNSQNAIRRVSPSRLERAYRRLGSSSVVTNNIIW